VIFLSSYKYRDNAWLVHDHFVPKWFSIHHSSLVLPLGAVASQMNWRHTPWCVLCPSTPISGFQVIQSTAAQWFLVSFKITQLKAKFSFSRFLDFSVKHTNFHGNASWEGRQYGHMEDPRLARALGAEVCRGGYTSSCTSQGSTLGTTNYVTHYATPAGSGRATGPTAQQARGEGGTVFWARDLMVSLRYEECMWRRVIW
jgi:hypothetical protein